VRSIDLVMQKIELLMFSSWTLLDSDLNRCFAGRLEVQLFFRSYLSLVKGDLRPKVSSFDARISLEMVQVPYIPYRSTAEATEQQACNKRQRLSREIGSRVSRRGRSNRGKEL
jgi:hypothetical protein